MQTSRTSLHKMPVIRDLPSASFGHVMSKPLKILSLASGFVVPLLFLTFVIIYKLDRKYYLYLTLEDNIAEWATFGFLLVSGIIALLLAVRTFKMRKRFVIFFGVFGGFCVLSALEEISWGQRLFRIESPRFFLENNSQREINVHNVI